MWFCDEIEARWGIFLQENPGVRYYELDYVATEEDPNHQVLTPSSIDDLALNFLRIDHSLSPYMQKIPKHSHVSETSKQKSGMTQEAKEEQSIEYSKQAPWCLQYEGTMNDSIKMMGNKALLLSVNEYYEESALSATHLARVGEAAAPIGIGFFVFRRPLGSIILIHPCRVLGERPSMYV